MQLFGYCFGKCKNNICLCCCEKMYYQYVLIKNHKTHTVHLFDMLLGRDVCNIIWFGEDENKFYYNLEEGGGWEVEGTILHHFCVLFQDFTRKTKSVNQTLGDQLTTKHKGITMSNQQSTWNICCGCSLFLFLVCNL